MYEVMYYKDGKQYTCDFTREKEAMKFAMKMKGIVLQDKEVLENFSE
jgi:hypothetical protein